VSTIPPGRGNGPQAAEWLVLEGRICELSLKCVGTNPQILDLQSGTHSSSLVSYLLVILCGCCPCCDSLPKGVLPVMICRILRP
jgi:hypothetical protein